jgi:hypothetical protein
MATPSSRRCYFLPQLNDESGRDPWREGFRHLQLPPAGQQEPPAISPPGVLLFAGCNASGRYLPRTTSA